MQALESYLRDLHEANRNEKYVNIMNPISVISDMNDLLARISEEEIGLCSSILFDEEKGLMAFVDVSLREHRNNKVMIFARKAAFDLVDNFVKQVNMKIFEYALPIVKFCLNIFRREQSNQVKQSTFGPIIKIIQLAASQLSAEKLGVSDMYEIYLREYLRGKSAQTVKGNILFILGVLSEYYPGELHEKSDQLLQIYMDTLNVQSNKAEPDVQLIAFCFKGLSHFFTQFGSGIEEGSQYVKPLYMYMCKALELVNAARHDVLKAALLLLGRHAFLFKEFLTVDAEKMFDRMQLLCSHKNEKVRRAAFTAHEAFISQVSYELVRGARSHESNIKTYKMLMTKFKLMLDERNSNRYGLSMSIRSFGQFAAPMKKFLGESDTKVLLLTLFKFSDQLLTRSHESLEDSVTHIPSFITAYANIILELNDMDEWILDHLERIIGILFLVFPKQSLFPKFKHATFTAMIKLFIALFIKQGSLNKFLTKIVHQGLTLTISNANALGDSEQDFRSSNESLYMEYLQLWDNLLNPNNITLAKWNYPWMELEFSADLQEHMHALIYDKIMTSLIQILNKLDLRCVQLNPEDQSSNPTKEKDNVYYDNSDDGHEGHVAYSDITAHLKPQNPKDFELYLNLVDFSKKFLAKCKISHFQRWVFVFCKNVIARANKFPYVSGFYKLLTVALKNCKRSSYFEGVNNIQSTGSNVKKEPLEEGMDIPEEQQEHKREMGGDLFDVDENNKSTCFGMISKFCKEVIHRLHEFKGELLASCIKFVLSVPKEFISSVGHYTTALKLAFTLGLSYLPLATVGLDTLEYWLKFLTRKQLETILPSVLPCLNQFLTVRSIQDEEPNETVDLNSLKSKNKQTIVRIDEEEQRKRKKGLQKLFSDVERTPLQSIQLRIIRLLGRFGGNNILLLKEDKDTNKKHILAWDTSPRVAFPFSFRDVKAEIYFDSVLPRIVELAEKSGDRQTKIAACEFLHSIMLYMIGKNAYSPHARQRAQAKAQQADKSSKDDVSESEPTPFYKLYEKIFPTLLNLSVDTEQVTRQLFEPFVYQMVRWFTQNMQYENKETMALLDAVIDGLSNPQDGALRDMCASLLNEFLKWSIKHDKLNKFLNVKSLFQRLYSNAHHPNTHKRLGAVLAFNRMYRTFREVDELVDQYVLDWLHNVIISLKMIHMDDEKTGIAEKTRELVGHIEKIIIYKRELLVDTKMERGYHTSLEAAVEWVFELPNFGSDDGPRRWVQSKIKKNGIHFVLSIIETSKELEHLDQSQNTCKIPQHRRIFQWMTNLEASIDSATWLFKNHLIYPHQIFPSNVSNSDNTNIQEDKMEDDVDDDLGEEEEQKKKVSKCISPLFKNFYKFISEIVLNNLNGLDDNASPSEEEKFNQRKSHLVLKVLDFMNIMCDKFTETTLQFREYLFPSNFFTFLFMCILAPSRIGFNTNQDKVQMLLPKLCKSLCTCILNSTNLRPLLKDTMDIVLRNLINKDSYLNLLEFDIGNAKMNMDDATFLFRGYRLLNSIGILEFSLQGNIQIFCTKLGSKLFEFEKQMSPVQIQIARELWELCFEFGFRPQILQKFLMDHTPWGKDDILSQKLSQIGDGDSTSMDSHTSTAQRVKLSKKGEVFYKNCQQEINKYIADNFPSFSQALLSQSIQSPHMIQIILDTFDYIVRYKHPKSQDIIKESNKFIGPLIQFCLRTDKKEDSVFMFELRSNVLKLFEKCNKIAASLFISSDNPAFDSVIQMYIFSLKSKRDTETLSLDLKIQAIRALPLIFKLDQTNLNQVLLKEIRNIVINEFPLTYKEIKQNTTEYDDHITLMEELITAMHKSQSIAFMEQILPLYRWRDHPLKDKMSNSLKKLFTQISNEELLQASNICLKTFSNELLPIDIRQSVIQWVMIHCLQQMPQATCVVFFQTNIKTLISSITNITKFDGCSSDEDIRALYVTRTCTLHLLEAMYRLLPANAIKESINKEFCGNKAGSTGKELTERVMRSAYSARCYEPNEKEMAAAKNDLVLEYHCAAYNALAAAVICTQTQEKLFTGFLFKEKNGDLWDKIVDQEKKYDFEVETNFKLYKKAVEELRVDANKATNIVSVGRRGDIEIKYLSSQYLSDSSLSDDIPYLGSFFIPGSRYAQTSLENRKDDGITPQGNQPNKYIGESIEDQDVLELDDINLNACMTTVLRMIDHMSSQFKVPSAAMPSWMQELYIKFTDPATSLNVRLFIGKILVNRWKLFEPHGDEWLKPLVNLLTSKAFAGTGIHYFMRDVCLVLLRWRKVIPPNTVDGRETASSLVIQLMKNCAHQKRMVLKSNLELIKLLVEKWKDRLRIPKDIILGWICFDEKKEAAKLARITGLQLLGVLIANEILPYDPSFDSKVISEDKYYEKIVENVKFAAKDVYEAAAEVCGMILSILSSRQTSNMAVHTSEAENNEDSYDKFERLLLGQLYMFHSKGEYDRFLNCLNKIGIHYVPFIDHFLPTKIIDILPNLFGVFKRTALQIMSWRAENITGLYQSLKPNIQPFLQHKEDSTQILTLQIVFKLLKTMEKNDILHFLAIISKEIHKNTQIFHAIFSEICRNMYYDILIWLYDNRQDVKDVEIIRFELLRGMADESQEIRKKLLDFWDHESRLSIQSLKRLEEMFSLVYSRDLSENWLKYASYLLIQLCHRNPDFEDSRALFPESLANCEFKEYNIDVSWQNRTIPMSAPLFSPSQNNNFLMGGSLLASLGPEGIPTENQMAIDDVAQIQHPGGGNNSGHIRATMAPQFSLTQISESVKAALSNPSYSQTSLLFIPFKKALSSSERSETSTSTSSSQQMPDPSKYVKRRFVKLKSDTLIQHHAKRASRLKKEKEAWDARQKMERKNRITMYRKYRTGELPDIQIAIKELILPLQALCLVDVKVANSVFVSLFSALYPEFMQKYNTKEANTIKDNIKIQMKKMMLQNKDCSPLMDALIHICLEHSEELLDSITPDIIRSVGMQSYNIENSILLLEKLILSRSQIFKSKSKIFTSSMDTENEDDEEGEEQLLDIEQEKETWIEIAKLYTAIGEEDIVRSVFEIHVSNQKVTKKALDQELNGDFKEAFKLYENALSEYYGKSEEMNPKPYMEEVNFWENQKLECLRQLNKWKELNQTILTDILDEHEEEIDIVNKIWDERHMELLFPLYMESSLKLNEKWGTLQAFVDISSQQQDKRHILESKYTGELSSLALFKDQYEKARSYIVESFSNFILQWSSLTPLSKRAKHLCLQKLQHLVEIEEFIDYIQQSPHIKKQSFLQLLQSWKARYPSSTLDNMNVWDEITFSRSIMFDKLLLDLTSLIVKGDNEIRVPKLLSDFNPEGLICSFSTQDQTDSMILDHEASTGSLVQLDTSKALAMISNEKQSMFITAAKAARKQSNWNVAHDYLKQSREAAQKVKSISDEAPDPFNFDFFSSLVKLLRVKANRDVDHKRGLDNMKKAHQYILQEREKVDNHIKDPYQRIKYQILLADIKRDMGIKLLEYSGESKLGNPIELLQSAFSTYCTAVDKGQQFINTSSSGENEFANGSIANHKLAKPFMKLGVFCDDLLRRKDLQNLESSEGEEKGITNAVSEPEKLAKNTVESYLSAMKLGNTHAQQRFPRLLELIERYPSTRNTFTRLAKQIPNYMFINWISQLLSHLSGTHGDCIIDLLLSIADDFPQSLYYPFNISKEDIRPTTEGVKQGLKQLDKKLRNPMISKFIQSLDKLTHPEFRWKDWYDQIKQAMKQQNKQFLKTLWEKTFDDLFDPNAPHIGNYNKKFAINWAPIMKKDFGTRDNPSKLLTMDTKTFEILAARHHQKMKETPNALQAGKNKLHYFSTWLADFNQSAEDVMHYIEIPGQYGGYENPNVEGHVKIVGFDPNILIMSSIRRPKRLKIHGNDEKDYLFLVKGGEDLRQDQRIEQLFSVMNDILRSDAVCSKRELQLKMYNVIPMSKNVGIIEWVDNTTPLKAIIESELAKAMGKDKVDILKYPTTHIHMSLLNECKGKDERTNLPLLYLKMFQKLDVTRVTRMLQQQWNIIPADLLKRGIENLAASPQAYFKLRNRFARSLAVFNICSYVLGIGDRHLENFLLDFSDGNIIGIDFGHAFGSATEVLPVPELMPFRMTRQITQVVAPLSFTPDYHTDCVNSNAGTSGSLEDTLPGKGGLFFESMVHTMQALHQNRDILLSTMDVFVKEPLVDWLKHAKIQGHGQQHAKPAQSVLSLYDMEESQEPEQLWYPQKKIFLAKRKLEMYNPVSLTLTDVQSNQYIKKGVKYFEKVINGDPRRNIRARTASEKCSSIKEQVACLVDMATDANILGRTYLGWCAWC